jgi:Na+-transporting methylmalonyl-CoA/oxaloacetate decarboxylase beta subunit
MFCAMTFNKMGTVPLPLALHLATHTVIGLFCAFAGGLNLIDPTKIFPNAVIFLGLAAFSWGYVFGILMARKEVVALGAAASLGYIVAGIWQLGPHWALGALLLAIGVYGLATIAFYRRTIIEA